MRKTFLITRATGKVGAAVARALAAQGIRARLARHAARPDADGHDAVPFDYDDPGTIRAALDGADGLLLLTPPSNRQADWAALTIDLAMSAGVDRIVRLSVAAAPLVPCIQLGRWHRMTERYLQASGARWTIVRPVPYMQNFLGMYSAADDGALTAPLGDGAISYVDTEDVGRFCAWALLNDAAIGEIHTVTGDAVLTTSEAVAALETALGTAIAYRPAGIGDWRRQATRLTGSSMRSPSCSRRWAQARSRRRHQRLPTRCHRRQHPSPTSPPGTGISSGRGSRQADSKPCRQELDFRPSRRALTSAPQGEASN